MHPKKLWAGLRPHDVIQLNDAGSLKTFTSHFIIHNNSANVDFSHVFRSASLRNYRAFKSHVLSRLLMLWCCRWIWFSCTCTWPLSSSLSSFTCWAVRLCMTLCGWRCRLSDWCKRVNRHGTSLQSSEMAEWNFIFVCEIVITCHFVIPRQTGGHYKIGRCVCFSVCLSRAST